MEELTYYEFTLSHAEEFSIFRMGQLLMEKSKEEVDECILQFLEVLAAEQESEHPLFEEFIFFAELMDATLDERREAAMELYEEIIVNKAIAAFCEKNNINIDSEE